MVKAPDGSISDPPFTRENMLPNWLSKTLRLFGYYFCGRQLSGSEDCTNRGNLIATKGGFWCTTFSAVDLQEPLQASLRIHI